MITADVRSHIEQLTWLRGFAAFLVIVSHTVRATEDKYTELDETTTNVLLSFFDLGTFGVLIFFTLSGCTLYISSHNTLKQSNLSGFYVKRFFRVWPAFAVSLVFYYLFRTVFVEWYVDPHGGWIERQFLGHIGLEEVVSYLTFTFNIWGIPGSFNNAYWSLPIEFQYYLIFPLVLFLIKRFGLIGPMVLVLVLYFFMMCTR